MSTSFSIVIPVHGDRAAMVMELVSPLLNTPDFHIICVDSSASAPLRDYCRQHAILYLEGPLSAAHKRNVGAAAADTDYVLFVDSDCLLDPRTLDHYRAAGDSGAAAVCGLTEMEKTSQGWLLDLALRGSALYNQCYDFPIRFDQVGWATTNNLLIRRDVFEQVGGFSTDLPNPVGGEDVDFGAKLVAAGFTMSTDARLRIVHRVEHLSWRRVTWSLFQYGRADVYLTGKYPKRTSLDVPPVMWAVVASLLLPVGRRPLLRAAAAAAAFFTASVVRARRTPYGGRRRPPAGDVAVAAVLDSAYDLGKIAQSLADLRPRATIRNYRYVDPEFFELGTSPRPRP